MGCCGQTEEELQTLTEKAAAEGGRFHQAPERTGRRGGRAHIVSRWTGIPVSKCLEGEMKKLVQMEERLRQRVIGQDEALQQVCQCHPPFASGTQ